MSPVGGAPLKTLILEDRADDAEIMVIGLEEAGFDVDWTRVDTDADYTKALHAGIDVVLADFTLPSFDVFHALGRLQEAMLSVPLIVVSGTISEEVAIECLKRGAADYLVKDRLARLPAAVVAALEQRRLRDENEAAIVSLRESAAELSDANAALRRANEVKDHVLAATAHELRTPLTSILGFTALLLKGGDALSAEEARECCETIDSQARRMISQVEDLLTLSRVEAGALDLHLEEVDIADTIERTVHLMGLSDLVDVECPGGLVVVADRMRVEQILTNYLGNAVRYGKPPITVGVTDQAGEVTLRLSDHGAGVRSEFVPYLFDRFTQAADREHSSGGFGLGLAIVRSLAQAHGGDAWYEPNDPVGACFAVRLPAQSRQSVASVAAP